ncbi:tetratricopeptide repeat protein [Telmatobacter sp. DSM 110680]|uniref:Tetratricopeptide repeat protein n=1 Tax=Telmatobacter sp. DSM 110680 TaxID=3036704 RepID=A0AAU7DLL0_9BACT
MSGLETLRMGSVSCYDGASQLGRQDMQHASSPARSFRFGLFEADVVQKTLLRNGVRVKIQDQPFRVLILLLERSGEIVGRDELRSSIWPDGTFVDFDGSLNVILKKLRAVIDDNPENPRFIETVPRRGYRFIAPVTVIRAEPEPLDAPASLPPPTTSAVGSLEPASGSRRSLPDSPLLYVAASVFLVVALSAGWMRWNGIKSAAIASTTPVAAKVSVRSSVAVLGFKSLSGASNDAWLGTALSEMLSTELASGDKLRLVSAEDIANLRNYSPWAKTDTLDRVTTSRIGSALDSDLLVLGSYTTIGKPEHGQIRVDARLQDAKTGEVMCEIAEIGASEDLFAIVSRIGGKLRNRLGVGSTGDSDETMVQATLPADPEAARFYALGLERLRAYDFETARGFFEQAIATEAGFPLAHSMLSRTELFLGHYDQAKVEAKKGVDLSSGLPRIQKMEIEASYDQALGDRGKAADIYRVLFNMFPDSLDYGLQLAKLQLDSYHPDESLETIRQLRRLPPPASNDARIDLREAPLQMRKDVDAAEKLFRTAAQKAQSQNQRLVYARAEQNLCLLNRQHLQNPPECHEAFEIYTAAGNRNLAGATLQIMAENQRLTGHALEAIPLYEEAIRTFNESGDYENMGVALNNLSLVYQDQGQWARAEEEYRKAKQNFTVVNDRVNLAVVTSNLADIEQWHGNFDKAERLYEEAREFGRAAKMATSSIPATGHPGMLLIKGELNDAMSELNAQVAFYRSWGGDPWLFANAVSGLGDVQRQQGDLNASQRSYEEAVEILKKANASTVNLQLSLIQLSIDRHHPDQAERELHDVIAVFEKDKNAGEELSGYLALGQALLAQGKINESKTLIQRAKKLTDLHEFPVLGMPLELLALRIDSAEASAAPHRSEGLLVVQRDLKSLIQRAHRIGFYTLECEARLALADVESKLSPSVGSAHLVALSQQARDRGFVLYADQAASLNSHPPEAEAMNKPPR